MFYISFGQCLIKTTETKPPNVVYNLTKTEIELNKLTKFDQFYLNAKHNRWYWYFSIFCRIILAYAFIVAGIVKVMDEKFASGLSEIHPMGAYLTALHHTGYYYPFIGVVQILSAASESLKQNGAAVSIGELG